jgi:hypothetical protein
MKMSSLLFFSKNTSVYVYNRLKEMWETARLCKDPDQTNSAEGRSRADSEGFVEKSGRHAFLVRFGVPRGGGMRREKSSVCRYDVGSRTGHRFGAKYGRAGTKSQGRWEWRKTVKSESTLFNIRSLRLRYGIPTLRRFALLLNILCPSCVLSMIS